MQSVSHGQIWVIAILMQISCSSIVENLVVLVDSNQVIYISVHTGVKFDIVVCEIQ